MASAATCCNMRNTYLPVTKIPGAFRRRGLMSVSEKDRLIGQFRLDELAVKARDVCYRLVLGALSLASACVGAVAEAQLLHLHYHRLGALCSLGAALRQQSQLADLRAYEEHRRAVLACSHACAAADACGAVHSLVGILLGYEDGVGILRLPCAHGDVAAGLYDLVERSAVNHAVLDYRERSRTPRLNGDDVAVVELAHVQLACGGSGVRAVRMTVNIQ